MRLEVTAPEGVPEVRPGADLAELVAEAVEPRDGDIVMVTSKVVSKAEDRLRPADERDLAIDDETVRLVAKRGDTLIVRHRLGLTMAAAGVDASNVEQGWILLLPEDPDASARRIREGLRARTGRNVAVVVTDTAGRAWRTGQTDIAIGAAGLVVTDGYAGRYDAYGNPLHVSELAVADELAGAAELVKGKLTGRPFAVLRGRSDLVLPAGEHGPGAVALVREDGADLFGYGAREAVVAAARGGDRGPFGAPVGAEELADALSRAVDADIRIESPTQVRVTPVDRAVAPELVGLVAFVHGWDRAQDAEDNDSAIRLRFATTTT